MLAMDSSWTSNDLESYEQFVLQAAEFLQSGGTDQDKTGEMRFLVAYSISSSDERADFSKGLLLSIIKDLPHSNQYVLAAKGILTSRFPQLGIKGEIDDASQILMERTLKIARHFLYVKHDIATARKYLTQVAEFIPSKWIPAPTNAQLDLWVIDSHAIRTLDDAITLAYEIIKSGNTENFLRRVGVNLDLLGIEQIDAKEYLIAILYNNTLNQVELRLVKATDSETYVNEETKTPCLSTYFLYRGKGESEWNSLNPHLNSHSPNSEVAIDFDDSLSNPNTGNIVNRNLSDSLAKKTQYLNTKLVRLIPKSIMEKVEIKGIGESGLAGLAASYFLLPTTALSNLQTIIIKRPSPNPLFAGIGTGDRVELYEWKTDISIHEIGHNWDMSNSTQEFSENDPSYLFYRISWRTMSPQSMGSRVIDACYQDGLSAQCVLNNRGSSYWGGRDDQNLVDFSRPYGMTDGYEDLATANEDYVSNTGNLSRESVREQMAKGNFNPAAKYLFLKYIRSFDPRDGRCIEYNLSKSSSPISLNSVKKQLQEWLTAHPGSVSTNTIAVIRGIELLYREHLDETERKQTFDLMNVAH
jgi:hypothetical protein